MTMFIYSVNLHMKIGSTTVPQGLTPDAGATTGYWYFMHIISHVFVERCWHFGIPYHTTGQPITDAKVFPDM